MSHTPATVGRRERNKQQKLARIIEAASELFAQRGIDDVTTQEIADRADIGTGTLFLYVKTKGELLLMVQNANYRHALERGVAAASAIADEAEAIMAIAAQVVECNRVQVDNGRAYLREIVFGDAREVHHRAALELSAKTERAIVDVLQRNPDTTAANPAAVARVMSAIMFTTMAVAAESSTTVELILSEIRTQLDVVLRT
jgi:TetR/AcrR family transcriptional regulator